MLASCMYFRMHIVHQELVKIGIYCKIKCRQTYVNTRQLLTMYSKITILMLLRFVVLYFQINLKCYFLSIFKYDFVAYKAHKIKRSYPLIRFKRIICTYSLYHNETYKIHLDKEYLVVDYDDLEIVSAYSVLYLKSGVV